MEISGRWICAAILGLFSLTLGIISSFTSNDFLDNFGKLIVILWTLGPPIWFWFDWRRFLAGNQHLDPDKSMHLDPDWAKHAHDLGRNVWVALTLVLAYLFKVPGIGH
jgi:hypothetical protein